MQWQKLSFLLIFLSIFVHISGFTRPITLIWVLLRTYCSSFLVEHGSSTRTGHLTLFCAVPFASFHVRCFLSNSAILARRLVCWGFPHFRFSCGFHFSALFTTCPSGLLNMWSIHPQGFCLISCSIGRWVLLERSFPPTEVEYI